MVFFAINVTLFAMVGAHCTRGRFFWLLWVHQSFQKGKFAKNSKIFQGFWIKKIFFSKTLYLRGSGLFVCAFSEILKMVFT